MNNEPVAWMDYLEHSDVYDLNVSGRGIPLYTHPVKELKNIVVASATCSCGKVMEVTNLQPVKELTDEEIIAEAEKQDWLGLKSESEWQPEIDFARAILRKAQEK